MRPRIAIPADTLTEATNIINERNAAFAPRPLIEAIVKSGGVSVIFPSVEPELAVDYLGLFDGIIFAGGADVDPTFYNEEPHQQLGTTYRKRDLFEIALLKQALAADKAVMGICRGMQLINIAFGGRSTRTFLKTPKRRSSMPTQDAPGNLPSHHVTVDEDSRLFNLVGRRPYVNSRHHQALHEIAPTLHVTAVADDQVPEAVESTANDQVLAVQWHPENMFKHYQYSQNLFSDLIQRAAAARQ